MTEGIKSFGFQNAINVGEQRGLELFKISLWGNCTFHLWTHPWTPSRTLQRLIWNTWIYASCTFGQSKGHLVFQSHLASFKYLVICQDILHSSCPDVFDSKNLLAFFCLSLAKIFLLLRFSFLSCQDHLELDSQSSRALCIVHTKSLPRKYALFDIKWFWSHCLLTIFGDNHTTVCRVSQIQWRWNLRWPPCNQVAPGRLGSEKGVSTKFPQN